MRTSDWRAFELFFPAGRILVLHGWCLEVIMTNKMARKVEKSYLLAIFVFNCNKGGKDCTTSVYHRHHEQQVIVGLLELFEVNISVVLAACMCRVRRITSSMLFTKPTLHHQFSTSVLLRSPPTPRLSPTSTFTNRPNQPTIRHELRLHLPCLPQRCRPPSPR